MCNCKLIGAKYFNEGLKKARFGKIKSIDSVRDTLGHGTMVSSIAVGNYVNGVSYFGYNKGISKGIDPHARFAIYRVMWNEGIDSSDVLAGIDQAISDGVDVISVSFHDMELPLYNNSIAIASFAAMEKGILVVYSAGNEGPTIGTNRNGFPWVLTDAAGTTNRWFAGTLTLENGVNFIGWSLFPGNTSLQSLPLVYNQTLLKCNSSSLLLGAPHGIIICDIGNIGHQLGSLAKASEYFHCPCIVLSSKEAQLVVSHTKSHTTSLATITLHQTFTKTYFTPAVAKYTSRGPLQSYWYVLKPDVMAPSSIILGAWPPKLLAAKVGLNLSLFHNYNIESGTSLACSHVTGVVALLKGKYPNLSPAVMTTTNPLDNSLNPIRDTGYNLQFASPLAMVRSSSIQIKHFILV